MTTNNSNDTSIVGLYDNQILMRNTFTNHEASFTFKFDGEVVNDFSINGNLDIYNLLSSELSKISWNMGLSFLHQTSFPFKFHLQFAFIFSIEKLSGISSVVPKKATYLRTILLEFERIIYHLNYLAQIIQATSFPLLHRKILTIQKKVKDCLQDELLILQSEPFIVLGGVNQSFKEDMPRKIFQKLSYLKEEFHKIQKILAKNRILSNILQDNGFLPRDSARELTITGPFARSSGLSNDIRKSDPYLAYPEAIFTVPVYDYCDLYGEVLVRADEIIQSFNIILQFLDEIPEGLTKQKLPNNNIISGNTITRLETPDGELFCFIISSNGTFDDCPQIVKIQSPLRFNQLGYKTRIVGEVIENLPYLLASINNGWKSLG